MEEWRDLFERAKQDFRDAALPRTVARFLIRLLAVCKIQAANCETALAKVLATSQNQGYEAAV